MIAVGKPTDGQAAAFPSFHPPEILKKIDTLRAQVRKSIGKVARGLPRNRPQTQSDLKPMMLEPLIRDRIAIAHPANAEPSALVDLSGFAIWASVLDGGETKIREQIMAGVWPIRLKAEGRTAALVEGGQQVKSLAEVQYGYAGQPPWKEAANANKASYSDRRMP